MVDAEEPAVDVEAFMMEDEVGTDAAEVGVEAEAEEESLPIDSVVGVAATPRRKTPAEKVYEGKLHVVLMCVCVC